MKPITIKIDLLKIDKSRVELRTYTNKEGVEVTEKNYSLDVVPLKEPKVLKWGDTWQLMKTHFVKETPTKEERQSKTQTKIVGNGITMMDKTSTEPLMEDVPF